MNVATKRGHFTTLFPWFVWLLCYGTGHQFEGGYGVVGYGEVCAGKNWWINTNSLCFGGKFDVMAVKKKSSAELRVFTVHHPSNFTKHQLFAKRSCKDLWQQMLQDSSVQPDKKPDCEWGPFPITETHFLAGNLGLNWELRCSVDATDVLREGISLEGKDVPLKFTFSMCGFCADPKNTHTYNNFPESLAITDPSHPASVRKYEPVVIFHMHTLLPAAQDRHNIPNSGLLSTNC